MSTPYLEIAFEVPLDRVRGHLHGDLVIPQRQRGTVLFAHGSGSSRHSPRNRYVAGVLQKAGFATLLLDLLTMAEERVDEETAALRFNVELLARRLLLATKRLHTVAQLQTATGECRTGYFGASTGAAAALVAAADESMCIAAVVSRGGRPDMAGSALERVKAPTLLIVGGNDPQVLELNRQALQLLRAHKQLEVIPGATHLFEEPGTLPQVAELALQWFESYLARPQKTGAA